MVFLVAYDDSPLARVALDRAVEFAAQDRDVVAVTVIPRSASDARSRGWLDDDGFDPKGVEERLRSRIEKQHTGVGFRAIHVEPAPASASIGLAIRRLARQVDAEIVFLGSQNAGRIVTNIVSVAQNVATDLAYDVHIVRSAPS